VKQVFQFMIRLLFLCSFWSGDSMRFFVLLSTGRYLLSVMDDSRHMRYLARCNPLHSPGQGVELGRVEEGPWEALTTVAASSSLSSSNLL
jgi:hypothetical protein